MSIAEIFNQARQANHTGLSGYTNYFDNLAVAGIDYHGQLNVIRQGDWRGKWTATVYIMASNGQRLTSRTAFMAGGDTPTQAINEVENFVKDWAQALEPAHD